MDLEKWKLRAVSSSMSCLALSLFLLLAEVIRSSSSTLTSVPLLALRKGERRASPRRISLFRSLRVE
jgi:hypothetical protein